MKYTRIAQELLRMRQDDQDMRKRDLRIKGSFDPEIDRLHTIRMKEIVESIGWPSISLVGARASTAAWLLVQHADRSIRFQQKCLRLMKQARRGDIDRQLIAYLEDRICVNRGLPQMYGTQFRQVRGSYVLWPLAKRSKIDALRASVGLGTLKEGVTQYHKKYRQFDHKRSAC